MLPAQAPRFLARLQLLPPRHRFYSTMSAFESSSEATTAPQAPSSKPSNNRRARNPGLTHFLAIPLHHAAGLQSSIDDFASSIPPELGITRSCIRPAACVHLTLGVMSLSDDKLSEAVQLLKDTDLQAILQSSNPKPATGETETDGTPAATDDPEPLKITLKGLYSMNSLKKTSVLYAPPVDASNRLQPFSEKLRDIFVDAGLVQQDHKHKGLKLHGTILHTIYGPKVKVSEEVQKKRLEEGKKKKGPQRLEFDAREMVEGNKERVWAEGVVVDKVGIFKMGARDKEGVKGGGGYELVAEKWVDGKFEEALEKAETPVQEEAAKDETAETQEIL